MTLDLWIPARTPPFRRTALEAVATLHEYEASGARPERLGRGDMLIADHDIGAALEVMPRLDGLRVVQTLSAGVDRIVDRIPAGITLCDASGVHDVAVAEWVVMAILASNRKLPQHVASQLAAAWRRDDARGIDLEGARVLIVGHGSIGAAVEMRLLPFGVEIDRVARTPRDGVVGMADLPALLRMADVVVILLPLTLATRGVVDATFLSRLRDGALLVNASRGGVVDTAALITELATGRIRAALDVTDPEPLPDGHPLWSMPGLIVTPHVAGDVAAEEDRAWRHVTEQVIRLDRGEPLRNVVVDGY